jgi:hypothetical protein
MEQALKSPIVLFWFIKEKAVIMNRIRKGAQTNYGMSNKLKWVVFKLFLPHKKL